MNERGFWCLGHVSDAELQIALRGLLGVGARTEARIVAHLAEVDARKLHLAVGASSLFDYCLSRLGLSNNEAFHRITAARLARRFSVIFELLETRAVHLTAVCLLRDYLTLENHSELLNEVSHKTKVEIEELLARRFPRPDALSRLRTVPSFEALSAGQYRLQLSVSAELKRKLELARDLMSHANPSGDLAIVVERGLDGLIEKLQGRRFAQTKSERSGQPSRANDGTSAGSGRVVGATKRNAGAESVRTGSAKVDARTSARGCGKVQACEVRASKQLWVENNYSTRESSNGGLLSEASLSEASLGEASLSEASLSEASLGEASLSEASLLHDSVTEGPVKRRGHVRHDVRRAVVARDGQRCTFTSDAGERCEARAFLQFHHERSWALGGADTAENLKLMCRAHNRLLAERELGAERVVNAINRARARQE